VSDNYCKGRGKTAGFLPHNMPLTLFNLQNT